jgi:hypothetical protein
MQAALPDLFALAFGGTSDPEAHDARILTPHTTTNANIVNDATNNALSMEASFITPPCASYPGATLGDSNAWRQPAAMVFPLWIASTTCARGTETPPSLLSCHQCDKSSGMSTMTRSAILIAAMLLAFAAPASAQHVITNPGWCAQFYPNANCQNLGPGNPYTSYGWRYAYGSQGAYAGQGAYVRAYPRRYYHRHRRY